MPQAPREGARDVVAALNVVGGSGFWCVWKARRDKMDGGHREERRQEVELQLLACGGCQSRRQNKPPPAKGHEEDDHKPRMLLVLCMCGGVL